MTIEPIEAAHTVGTGASPRQRELLTHSGRRNRLPMFLPVYQPHSAIVPMDDWNKHFEIEGCIVNSYFLYKNRETRERFENGLELHDYLNFQGLVMTDSGAFQQLTRKLLLRNKTIVEFQDLMGADIISPLDLITPPGDKRTIAEKKSIATTKRVREAKSLAKHSTLASVQQGGRFRDLRKQSVEALAEIGMDYLAIGSLVPFFNKRRNLEFVGHILRDARGVAGPDVPMHVYGAGDPLELPFLVQLGADIFDSSSYGHYAIGGYYMTSYGALKDPERLRAGEYRCECHVCSQTENPADILGNPASLSAHNLWTIVDTIKKIRRALEEDRLPAMLSELLELHMEWFPDSELGRSWNALHA